MEKMENFEKAIEYFENKGIKCYFEDSIIYIVVNGMHIAISDSEVSYRADIQKSHTPN